MEIWTYDPTGLAGNAWRLAVDGLLKLIEEHESEGLLTDGRRPLCNLHLCLPLLLCRQMPLQADASMSQEGFITELCFLFLRGEWELLFEETIRAADGWS